MDCPLAEVLAGRLRAAREQMTERWLERISQRASIDPNEVFPSDALLDHIPLLMDGIADYMENPAEEISADDAVIAKAMELGEMRLSQGFSAHEVLKEYEILGGVLFAFLVSMVDDINQDCSRSELLSCAQRLFRAVTVIQQFTTTHYLRLADEQVSVREEKLRGFNRLVTHELKTRISAAAGATAMLREPFVFDDRAQRDRFLAIAAENLDGMQQTLENLLSLSRMDSDPRRQGNVELRAVAAEAARGLREMAETSGVDIRIADDMPEIDVDSAAVELCLVNYLSNAIKYADSSKSERWVEVRAHWSDADAPEGELVVEVRDNGIGVPPDRRAGLFGRFYRAHDTVVPGTGIGLSIVMETAQSLGGRAWVEFDDEGSAFKFSLPARRRVDEESSAADRVHDA
ncbi:MAG TPA: sensor histidine kinase [Longimicrobiales bacterium]|nr:sensor histidine kinase [Longimicrobiales bacterium]